MRLILASASPRRAELIKKVAAEFRGLAVEIIPSGADETVLTGEPPEVYAMRVAAAKAGEVYGRVKHDKPGAAVLGCDTVVTLDGRIYGKPADKAEVEEMFRALCGKTHEVVTGVCLVAKGKKSQNFEKTYVTFGAFDEKIVYNYIKSGAPFDKAGGYGLQDETLSPLIVRVEGDRDNVIGLPAGLVISLLRQIIN